ncbi:CcmD family protein [Herpetosiphon giganteus]|uniref:CcmD family protein n=1 Tax=Herpetosiphon giganteus TaxID=2029754 RepID=UPI00195B4081|nr:CcmD family protein [Herpetosiphon giganteus]MBM7842410.1 CcmD family protein [Herpetosiphon giganteus]
MNGLTDPGLAMYVAAAVTLVVWLGIFAYLLKIDRQAKALRQALQERQANPSTEATNAPIRPERVNPERKETSNV